MSGSPRRRRVRREEDISGQFRVTVPDAEDLDQLRTRGGVYRRGLYPLGNRGNAPPEGTQSLPASSRESSTEPMDTDGLAELPTDSESEVTDSEQGEEDTQIGEK